MPPNPHENLYIYIQGLGRTTLGTLGTQSPRWGRWKGWDGGMVYQFTEWCFALNSWTSLATSIGLGRMRILCHALSMTSSTI